MQPAFPRPLVACIAEGRSPTVNEFDQLTASVLLQAFGNCSAVKAQRLAEAVADFAFHGRPTFRA